MPERAGPRVPGGDVPAEPTPAGSTGGDAFEGVDIHRLLVASVRDYAIFVLDPDGYILTWNGGAERLKGYTAEEAIGRHFSMFYATEALDRDHPATELVIAAREGRYEEEGWRLRKDGGSFWASVTITPLRNEAGTLIGFAKVTRDLTERRASELQAIEDARRVAQAEAANRAKSEFLTAMSHELRTPLNAIGGYTDLLALGVHGPVSEAQLAALERVKASQQHLLGLINDLLNFSRIEAGRISYRVEPVDLSEVARSVETMTEPHASSHGIEIVWHASDAPVVALADRGRVEQILLNLVTNGVKYTEHGGRVDVRYYREGDVACFQVVDTGIGIPPEFLEAIFEPFTQVGRSYSSAHAGTGLGLAISRDLARAMEGDLTVRSSVGTGSAFTLTLPAAP
jgi:PAS domain S-box-containing protein